MSESIEQPFNASPERAQDHEKKSDAAEKLENVDYEARQKILEALQEGGAIKRLVNEEMKDTTIDVRGGTKEVDCSEDCLVKVTKGWEKGVSAYVSELQEHHEEKNNAQRPAA